MHDLGSVIDELSVLTGSALHSTPQKPVASQADTLVGWEDTSKWLGLLTRGIEAHGVAVLVRHQSCSVSFSRLSDGQMTIDSQSKSCR